MIEAKTYAVLQFVEQRAHCHMVHDSILGNTLMEYVKGQIILEKQKAFRLAQSIAEQLEQFYLCEEQEAYGYVTPYAVIINEEGEARLLDIWAEENKNQLIKMKKKKVRVLFISPSYVLSQRRREEDDWFGYGKTIQFLMEKCCEQDSFNRYEKNLLKKLYLKCQDENKADIEGWRTIQKLLQKAGKDNERRYKISIGRPIALLVMATFIIGIVIGTGFVEESEPIIIEKPVEVMAKPDETEEAYLKMLELNTKETLSVEEQEELHAIVEKVEQEGMKEENLIYQKCLAQCFEKLGKYEAAIVKYEEFIEKSVEEDELKYAYKKLIELYDFVDLLEKKNEIYVEAIEKFPEWEMDVEISEENNVET